MRQSSPVQSDGRLDPGGGTSDNPVPTNVVSLACLAQDVLPSVFCLAGVAQSGRAADL